ncbi:MAG TPA: hypothetical protein VHY08_02105, partial [Bacillota bacterium]|nr:hypothetical protein [Bacillota bacterium]
PNPPLHYTLPYIHLKAQKGSVKNKIIPIKKIASGMGATSKFSQVDPIPLNHHSIQHFLRVRFPAVFDNRPGGDGL